ncbi:four-carbon acid sugar kinase family protein [Amnibacterium kyonggiense]
MLVTVLDDDPTGTQSAADVSVLLRWTEDELRSVLDDEGAVYLQTNSRAVDEAAAIALSQRIRAQIEAAARDLGQPVLVVLRGDSTLRGHVMAECDVFAGDDGRVLFVPAFPAGGRTTRSGVHRVVIDGVDTPVAESEFAQDPVFGYRSSDLVAWVREKGDRRAAGVPLEGLRASRGAAVADALEAAGPREFVVPDAVDDADIALIRDGLLEAIRRGVHVVVRSGAPLAAGCAGRLSTGYLPRPVPVGDGGAPAGGVLVVCGSHTRAATQQLDRLQEAFGLDPVVIRTDDAFADPGSAGRDAADRARSALARGGVAVVATERVRRDADGTLDDGERVMQALMTAATALVPLAGVVVSKGGITAAETASTAFGATRAHVRGQIAPGISVWDLDGVRGSGVQVVVPGNVGGPDTLVDALAALGRTRTEEHGR